MNEQKNNEPETNALVQKSNGGGVSGINEEKAQKLYEKHSAKAKKLLGDADKIERFLQKLEKKLRGIPVAGEELSCIPLMASLIRSYVKKEYPDLPIVSAVAIVATLIYFLSPFDLIPDFIPVWGYADDALVVATCLKLVKDDIKDYVVWREKNGKVIEDIPDYEEVAKKAEDPEKYKLIERFAKLFSRKKSGTQNQS